MVLYNYCIISLWEKNVSLGRPLVNFTLSHIRKCLFAYLLNTLKHYSNSFFPVSIHVSAYTIIYYLHPLIWKTRILSCHEINCTGHGEIENYNYT